MALPGIPEILSFGNQGYGDELLRGAWMTLQISVCAYFFGFTIGLACAMGKLSGNRPLYAVLHLYTTFVRASPELILILLLYYAGTGLLNSVLASYGFTAVHVSGFTAAVAVLGFMQG